MIIPKQDKVKRLLLLQLDAQVSEEKDQKSLQKWIQATLSKQKNQELGIIVIMQPLQSVQMSIIKIKHLLCSPLTALPNHYLMLHRHWRIHMLRNQRANNIFLIVLHRFGTNIYVLLLGNWKTIAMKISYPLYGSKSIFWDYSSKPRWWSPQLWTLRWWRWVFTPSEPYKDPHHLKSFSYSTFSLSNYPLGVSNVQ